MRLLLAQRHFSASICIPQESTSVVVDNVVSENVGSVRHEVSKETKSPDPKDKQLPEVDTYKANNIHSIEEVQETVASEKDSELLEGIDNAVKSLTSEEYQEESNELLNINFRQELNFGMTGSVADDDLGLNVSNHLKSANNQQTENNHLEIVGKYFFIYVQRIKLSMYIDSIHATGLVLYPLKAENQRFSDVFRGY